ncbi:MAG TPA: hypothetical protein VGC53_20460, partial [Vicinamibacteria bacterium]
ERCRVIGVQSGRSLEVWLRALQVTARERALGPSHQRRDVVGPGSRLHPGSMEQRCDEQR